MFYNQLQKYLGRIVLIDEKSTTPVYYDDLIFQINMFLKHVTSTKKSLFFILCKNNVQTVIAYLAVLQSKHAALLLAHDTPKEFLEQLMKCYKPDYIWSDIFIPSSTCCYSQGGYCLWKSSVDRKIELLPELKLLLSTSGSTGSSKLVRLTAENLEANAESISEYLQLTSEERPITVLPMNYSYGLSIINSHLLVGATILLTQKSVVQQAFWDFLEKYEATSLSGVPYTYEIFEKIGIDKIPLKSVKTFTQAGGKLSAELTKKFYYYCENYSKRFFIMYGQTEATARITYLPYTDLPRKLGSIGISIPHGQLYLQDTNGHRIDRPNQIGEMVYIGKNVMLGYAHSEVDLTLGDQNHSILETGDLAYYDEDSYFYITGRKKRNIKILGNRVNLDEVEQFLLEKGFHCYTGGEDDLLKLALFDLKEESKIKKILFEKTQIHPSCVQVRLINDIPRNSYGKIDYSRLFR